MDHQESHDGLDSFERALRRMQPRPSAVDRDQLMFMAGQQTRPSAAPQVTRSAFAGRWAAAAAVLLLAGFLTGRAFSRTEVKLVEKVVYMPQNLPEPAAIDKQEGPAVRAVVQTPAAAPVVSGRSMSRGRPELSGALARMDYVHARNLALRLGVEALPIPMTVQAAVSEMGQRTGEPPVLRRGTMLRVPEDWDPMHGEG